MEKGTGGQFTFLFLFIKGMGGRLLFIAGGLSDGTLSDTERGHRKRQAALNLRLFCRVTIGENLPMEPIVRKSRFFLVTLLCLCAAAVLYVMAYRALGHYLSDGEKAYPDISVEIR